MNCGTATRGRSRRLFLVLALIGCQAKNESQPPGSSSEFAASSSPSGAGATGPRQASSCGDEVLGDEGIGALRIGTTVAAVRDKCNVVRDTTAMGVEGMPARKLAVVFSRDTVEAEIVDDRVWRIAVHSPHFRTSDSLGVGTTLARLLQLRSPRGMTGEGQFFVASPEHCGMTFRLANAGSGARRGDLGRAGLAGLSKSAVVSQVLIFGCRAAKSADNP